MKAKCLFYLSLVMLFIFGIVASGITIASADESPIVYVDPPYNCVPASPAPQYFTVNISIAEVTNLYSWQIKLYIKKSVLETNDSLIEEGPFLSQNGAYLTELNKNYDGLYWTVGCHIVGPESVDGSGTLASITFKVLKEGESNIALIETKLFDPDVTPIPHTNERGYFNSEKVKVINVIEVGGQNFTIIMITNSSVSPVPFNLDIGMKEISFNVIGLDGMIGYCNVTIPKNFMNCTNLADWNVTVDGVSPPYFPTPTDNATHTFVYFTYATSTKKVEITSIYIVPEFSAIVFLPLFIIATIAATIIRKKSFVD